MNVPKVFISYPNENYEAAAFLASKLQREGIDVWFDNDRIRIGDYIVGRITEGLQNSICCILVMSKYTLESKWCHAEVGAFWGVGKPVFIYQTQPIVEPPKYLADLRYADRRTLNELIDEIKELIRRWTQPEGQLSSVHIDTLTQGGLSAAFRIPEQNPERMHRVKELVNDPRNIRSGFLLAASSGYSYLRGEVWKAGLGKLLINGDTSMQVVLESPFSSFALTRAIANRVTIHTWEDKMPPEILIPLLQYPNITIRVTDVPVNCSLFFAGDSVFYDPYLWALPHPLGRTENTFWVFELKKVEDSRFDCWSLLKKHFGFLLQESILLEDFLCDQSSLPSHLYGKKFYDFWKEHPQQAIDTYRRLTQQFHERLP